MQLQRAELPHLLLIDDDETFCAVLARALENRGFDVLVAHDGASAARVIDTLAPEYAVVDLRLPDMSGLKLVAQIKSLDENARVVVLTGYGSISTAIDAIRLGATSYLTKPANADDIMAAFAPQGPDFGTTPEFQPLSVERVEWEHIQRVLADLKGNISAAARAMNMHRRTLQRKLGKNPPRT